MENRARFIDYGKAVMIVPVVLFHVGITSAGRIGYILMTYFFMAAGFCYTKGKRPLKENIGRRFQSILIPFWIAMAVYALFEIFRAGYMGYGDAGIVLPGIVGMLYGSGHNLPYIPGISDRILEIMSYKSQTPGFVDVILPTNCHLWFLPAMFCGSVLFFFYAEKIRPSKAGLILFSFLMLLLASVETLPFMIQLPYGLGRGFYAAACMAVGYELKEKSFLEPGRTKPFVYAVLAVLSVVFHFLGARESAFVRSVYGPYGMLGAFITFAGGICACTVIFALLKKLDRYDIPVLERIGQNTMTVYTWHMIFLTVFSLLLLKICNLEIARDEYFMSIIPQDRIFLMVLASVLSIAASLLIVRRKAS